MITFLLWTALLVGPVLPATGPMPEFKLGTVLVWKSENRGHESSFVVRLARFGPTRYFEWESVTTQGTVLLQSKALESAKKYATYKLFQAGADLESADETCYWLSRELFADLKAGGKTSFYLDGIKTPMELLGSDELTLLVNQQERRIPTVKFKDGRGGTWWILDDPANPMVVKRQVNTFEELLSSVNTDRPDSLRWIKGAKLKR